MISMRLKKLQNYASIVQKGTFLAFFIAQISKKIRLSAKYTKIHKKKWKMPTILDSGFLNKLATPAIYCYFPKKAHTKQKLKIKCKINFKKFSILCADRQHNVLNQDIECAH